MTAACAPVVAVAVVDDAVAAGDGARQRSVGGAAPVMWESSPERGVV